MTDPTKSELLALLKKKSVFYGDFVLSSGARSKYYIDCRLTTLDAQGAWLVGKAMFDLIRGAEASLGVRVAAVGGLTMGADPIALATGMISAKEDPAHALKVFSVRKAQKAHGQTKLIEGNFTEGDQVVIVEDTATTGESALKAIDAVVQAKGKVAFVGVLVDREQGGRQNIEAQGYKVFSIFTKEELLGA
jgi:orotate phosphoribosyltransferase